MGVLYEQEGRRGYYYGVVSRNLLGVAGIANIGYPVSVGSDVDYVHTHEVGHTMNLYHAPCGGAGGPDPQYPYENGSIGVWGYDMAEGMLLDPAQYTDVMSYCFDNIWISDYQFDRAMTHRLNGDGGVNHDAAAADLPDPDRGEMLVVWGGVWEGRLSLEPAFVLEGPVVLPESDGPYRVEGLGENGETRFSLSFSPVPLDHGGSSFVFFVPYEREWADNLERMVLTGPEGESTLTRDGESEMAVAVRSRHRENPDDRQRLGRRPSPRRGACQRDGHQGHPGRRVAVDGSPSPGGRARAAVSAKGRPQDVHGLLQGCLSRGVTEERFRSE